MILLHLKELNHLVLKKQ